MCVLMTRLDADENFQILLAVNATCKWRGLNKLGVTTAQIKFEHLAH